MYRSKKIDDSGQVIVGSWRDRHLQEGGQVYNISHLSLPHPFHHRQSGAGTILSRFGTTWSPWSCHGSYSLHGLYFLGSKPYYSTTDETEAFLRIHAQFVARAATNSPSFDPRMFISKRSYHEPSKTIAASDDVQQLRG